MTRWNPNSSNVLGLEWHPSDVVRVPFLNATQPEGWKMTAAATEDISVLKAYLTNRSGSITEAYAIEVYENGVYPDTVLHTVTFRPSHDHLNLELAARGWDGSADSFSNIYTKINNVTQIPVALPGGSGVMADDDFIYQASVGCQVDFNFDGMAAATAGQHVTRVRLSAKAQPYNLAGGSSSMVLTPYLLLNNQYFFGAAQAISGRTPGGHLVSCNWDANPSANRPWISSDLAAFDQGTNTGAFGWLISGSLSSRQIATILQGWVEVEHLGTEKRKALNGTSDFSTTGLDGWVKFSLIKPVGTDKWAKVNGTTYRITLRRLTQTSGGKSASYRYLSGHGPDAGANTWSRLAVTYHPYTYAPLLAAPIDNGLLEAPAVLLYTAPTPDPTFLFLSNDSQPYSVSSDPDTLVNATYTLRQKFTTPGSFIDPIYSSTSLLLKRESSTALDGDLTLTLRRSSDNASLGVATITEADHDEVIGGDGSLRTSYAEVTALFTPAATLSTSTNYYLELTTPASAGSGWVVQVLFTNTPGAVTIDSTQPTDLLPAAQRFISGSWQDYGWGAVEIMSIPLPPQSLAAAAVDDGVVSCRQVIHLTWTEPTSDFVRYEGQRSDAPGGPWVPIISSTSVTTEEFYDDECRLSLPTYYRMRTVRADGAISAWSDVVTATAVMACCGYVFSSNGLPELSLFAADESRDGTRTVDWPQNVEVKEFYGRDYRVVFQELEWRGNEFERDLLIAAESGATLNQTPLPVANGVRAFTPLHRITRIALGYQLPYVCVRNERGDRWFASVLTPSTVEYQGPDLYMAHVKVVEVTGTPAVSTLFRCTTVDGLSIILVEDNCSLLLSDSGHFMLEDQ